MKEDPTGQGDGTPMRNDLVLRPVQWTHIHSRRGTVGRGETSCLHSRSAPKREVKVNPGPSSDPPPF